MRPVTPAPRTDGFTLVEAAVVVAVLAILLGIAVPSMSNWLLAKKAAAAAVFYREGLAQARSQAVAHNSASRLVLLDNANGQMDWRVDICFPTLSTPCNDSTGSWSTASAPAGGDPDESGGFRSLYKSSAALPGVDAMTATVTPLEAESVVFTPLGWVDTRVAPRIARLTLAPARKRSGAFPRSAVALTLAGVAGICDPDAAAHAAKGCPP
ncbi:prepilin-type N-terminal cleavage/methylation domain-containing protein [Massilia forsythiae]|uniref:Type II secretion system protein H n=1 Tax=Massilia forsythiae TaxID=2728020 RepID=A0A7Z2VZI8_9BURK|nr:GspH/FimT family pseudopilin [Massilia forsythiae]QJE02151.1 prepilin-type N-terminal cleavage/methylation domain-containing protein [Massilia forsythiae]